MSIKIALDPRNTPGIMAAKLWLREGSRADPSSQKGIHHLLGSLLSRGCGPYSSIALADIIESYGAGLRCETLEDGLLLSLKCCEKDGQTLLPIMMLMIMEPHLNQEDIELERRLTIQSIYRQKENPFHLAFNGWRKLAYGDGPYGHDTVGLVEDIKTIRRQNLLEISSQFIHRKKFLVISGSFNERITNSLHDHRQVELSKPKVDSIQKKQKVKGSRKYTISNESIILNYQKTGQVVLLLGTVTVAHSHEIDLGLRLLGCHLGSGMSSHLFKKLREEYGVTYDVGIFHPVREQDTPFLMHASTTEEKALLTLRLLKECWQRILNNAISAEELALAKAKFRGNIAHNIQTVSQRAERKVHLMGLNMNREHDWECLDKLSSIKSDDLLLIAQSYLKDPFLSLCGPKKILDKLFTYWKSNC